MELRGETVNHKFFGRGQIIGFENNYVTVLFEGNKAERKFTYPTVFNVFLELDNKVLLKEIEKDITLYVQKEADNKRIIEEQEKSAIITRTKSDKVKHLKNTSAKISDCNNIAFKCNYCDGGNNKEAVGFKGVCSDETMKYNIKVAKHIWCRQPENKCYKHLQGEISREEICKFYETTKSEFSKSICYESQMLEIWNTGAGITQNCDEKGRPMALRSVKANSLAILTTKLPYAKDAERFIFAVFLIDENYEGDNADEGYVGANQKYRIQLSLDESKKLKFWDYYFNPNKPEKIIFGSGLHRYLTDIQAAQVLKNICRLKKGTKDENLSNDFLEYYCRIKKLDIESIPMENGPLQRLKIS